MKSKVFVFLLIILFLFALSLLLGTSSLLGADMPEKDIFESVMYDNVKIFSKKIGFLTNVNQQDKEVRPLLFYTMSFGDKGQRYENMVLLLNKGADI
ncbi:MAG: hypothetical protein WCS96_02325 [Victivallales bacterium]